MLADAELSLGRFEPAAATTGPHGARPAGPEGVYGLGRSYEGLSGRAFETLQQATPDLRLPVAPRRRRDGGRERDKSRLPPLPRGGSRRRPAWPRPTRPCEDLTSAASTAEWAAVERAKAEASRPRLPDADPGVRVPSRPVLEVLEMAGRSGTAASRYWTSRAAGELAARPSPASRPCRPLRRPRSSGSRPSAHRGRYGP